MKYEISMALAVANTRYLANGIFSAAFEGGCYRKD